MIKVGFEYREIPRRDTWVNLAFDGKSYGMPLASIKVIAMFWLFCGVAFFAYTVGKADTYQNTLMTAYLCKGGIKTIDGGTMLCEPALTEKNDIKWNCKNTTATLVNVNGSDPLD